MVSVSSLSLPCRARAVPSTTTRPMEMGIRTGQAIQAITAMNMIAKGTSMMVATDAEVMKSRTVSKERRFTA